MNPFPMASTVLRSVESKRPLLIATSKRALGLPGLFDNACLGCTVADPRLPGVASLPWLFPSRDAISGPYRTQTDYPAAVHRAVPLQVEGWALNPFWDCSSRPKALILWTCCVIAACIAAQSSRCDKE
jgi:hypothetical protein